MKKFVSILLVLVLVLSLSIVASAAGSPTKPSSSGTTAAPVAEETEPAIGLYNGADEEIGEVPEDSIIRVEIADADSIEDEADREAFLAAYEEAKAIEGKVVKYFFWLDIPEEFKTDDFAYALYKFTCTGENVQVLVNGNEMEVEEVEADTYEAKLTEFGAVAILCD